MVGGPPLGAGLLPGSAPLPAAALLKPSSLLLPCSRLLLCALRLPLFASLLGRPLLLLLDALLWLRLLNALLLWLGVLGPLDLLRLMRLLGPLLLGLLGMPLLLPLIPLLPLLLLCLRSTLLLRGTFVRPALRPVGLTLLFSLLIALSVVLCVHRHHRCDKEEDRSRKIAAVPATVTSFMLIDSYRGLTIRTWRAKPGRGDPYIAINGHWRALINTR